MKTQMLTKIWSSLEVCRIIWLREKKAAFNCCIGAEVHYQTKRFLGVSRLLLLLLLL